MDSTSIDGDWWGVPCTYWLMFGLNTMQQEALLDDGQKLPTPKANHYFMSGLLTNLSNPKTLIYFSSVFSLALSSSKSLFKNATCGHYSNPNFYDFCTADAAFVIT
jgi:threonine/homoserine/homoserine lactone efflux protein